MGTANEAATGSTREPAHHNLIRSNCGGTYGANNGWEGRTLRQTADGRGDLQRCDQRISLRRLARATRLPSHDDICCPAIGAPSERIASRCNCGGAVIVLHAPPDGSSPFETNLPASADHCHAGPEHSGTERNLAGTGEGVRRRCVHVRLPRSAVDALVRSCHAGLSRTLSCSP